MIAIGRDAMHTEGFEVMGRVTFRDGIAEAKEAFKDAKATNDLKTIFQAQITFVKQDLFFAPDKYAETTFKASITDLEDALTALTAHDNKTEYIGANKTYSTRRPADRKDGLPYDVVHKTLRSEIARLTNSMRSNTMSPVERELTVQRIENMWHGQKLYKAIQKESLTPTRSKDKELEM